jgi:hypothetical protein
MRQTLPQIIDHSDRGSQYCSDDCRRLLQPYGITALMSGKGNCYDCAMVETVFKTIRSELNWRANDETRVQAELALGRYIDGFCNPRRRHSALRIKIPHCIRSHNRRDSLNVSPLNQGKSRFSNELFFRKTLPLQYPSLRGSDSKSHWRKSSVAEQFTKWLFQLTFPYQTKTSQLSDSVQKNCSARHTIRSALDFYGPLVNSDDRLGAEHGSKSAKVRCYVQVACIDGTDTRMASLIPNCAVAN